MWEQSIYASSLSNASGYLPALLITLGLATFVGCAISVACSLCDEEEDELFKQGDGRSYLRGREI